jgi:hypothetical protein
MRWTWWADEDMYCLVESLQITVEQQLMAYEVAEGHAADQGRDFVKSADVYYALEGYPPRKEEDEPSAAGGHDATQ